MKSFVAFSHLEKPFLCASLLFAIAGCGSHSSDSPTPSIGDPSKALHLGGKDLSTFKADPVGVFTATSAETTTKPDSATVACFMDMMSKHQQTLFNPELAVGQKFVSVSNLPILGLNENEVLKQTVVLTAVASNHVEFQATDQLNDNAPEATSQSCDLKSSDASQLAMPECQNKNAPPPSLAGKFPQSVPPSENCLMDPATETKDESWTLGRFALQSGKTVDATKHVERVKGTRVCQTGNGPKTNKGSMKRVQISIVTNEILSFDSVQCGEVDLFNYQLSTDDQGQMIGGSSHEVLGSPTLPAASPVVTTGTPALQPGN